MRRHSEATAALHHSWQLKQEQEEQQQRNRQEERQKAARVKQQHEQLIEVGSGHHWAAQVPNYNPSWTIFACLHLLQPRGCYALNTGLQLPAILAPA